MVDEGSDDVVVATPCLLNGNQYCVLVLLGPETPPPDGPELTPVVYTGKCVVFEEELILFIFWGEFPSY